MCVKKKISFIVVSIFFIIMIGFGSYKILSPLYEYRVSQDMYNSLEVYSNVKVIDNTYESKVSLSMVDFKSLKEINEDIVAWISIDDLNINYPIVQGVDNDFYLNHMANGNYNSSGSIYMDYRNKNDFSNKHTIIYGHNMQNGTMFSNLTKYKHQEYYDNNKYYLLMTPNRNYKVEIVSGYVTDVNDNSWNIDFSNDISFNEWINDTINKSLIKTNVEVSEKDNFITLSTCSYEFDNARFILVGILS